MTRLKPSVSSCCASAGFAIVAVSAIGPSCLSFVMPRLDLGIQDRKSTRLNSSHLVISYAVFCLKKQIKLDLIYEHLANDISSSIYSAFATMHFASIRRRVGTHATYQPYSAFRFFLIVGIDTNKSS